MSVRSLCEQSDGGQAQSAALSILTRDVTICPMGECLLISFVQASMLPPKDLLVLLPLQASTEGNGMVDDLMRLGTPRDW